eukprot:1161353-Pelagomonas_calceolata.AAC.5
MQCPLGKSCRARPAHARLAMATGVLGHSSRSNGSIRRRRKPPYSGSSGKEHPKEDPRVAMKTEQMSSQGRGTAWEEQVYTYMPVGVQLLIASNNSVLNWGCGWCVVA